jgi:hypothetical protein
MILWMRVDRILRGVAVVIPVLAALSMFVEVLHYKYGFDQIGGAYRLFSLDMEGNVPTLFSALMLVSSAVLVFIWSKSAGADRRYWLGIAIMLLYVSIDEAVQLHEPVMMQIRRVYNLGGFFYFDWTLPGVVLVSVLGVVYLRFLRRQPPLLRRRILTAALVYVSGALGMELIDGKYASIHGEENLGYDILTNIEEALEMIGAALMLCAMLRQVCPTDIVLRLK